MGYVTKTTVETVNDISASTTLHFELFEDFLKYESRFEEVQQEVGMNLEGQFWSDLEAVQHNK